MVCLYCGGRLPLLRNLELGEFCSAAHREQFERLQHEFREADGVDAPTPGRLMALRTTIRPRDGQTKRRIAITAPAPEIELAVPRQGPQLLVPELHPCGKIRRSPVTAEPGYVGTMTHAEPCTPEALHPQSASVPGPTPLSELLKNGNQKLLRLALVPLPYERPVPVARPSMVRLAEEPVLAPLHVAPTDTMEAIGAAAIPAPPPQKIRKMPLGGAFQWVVGWRSMALAASAAVLVFLVAHGWQPAKAAEKFPVAPTWEQMRKDIASRAAIDMVDDFRSGLDSWSSPRRNLGWSYDQVGFIRPTGLAIYDPSLKLTDYSFEFLGELRNKGIGVAVRATDMNNYYAVRLAVVRPGPIPLMEVVRYPVIHGHEGRHSVKPLPVTIRPDSLFRARILTDGDEFTLMVEDQIVDFWSDARFRTGGVGFFCLRGDDARLRWVEITHHDDTLGRLCALIAPYNVTAANGSWEK